MLDHLFPHYHVRPPTGFLNDPNGPIWLDGVLHLYFQYRHTLDPASPVLWGHVTSPDLVHWDYHRPALAPHPRHSDRDGCWSGNTVLDDAGRVRAFYSGCVDGEPLQRTLSATSVDGGYSFGPPREVVPNHPADDDVRELRDPFVWRSEDGWRMVLGARTSDETATIRLYTSGDLDTWTYRGPLARMPRVRTADLDSGAMWECPQIVRLDGAEVAVVGGYAEAEGTLDVFSFALAGEKPGPLHRVDHGPDFYAASVLDQRPDRCLMWGWATEGRSPDWCREDGWSGMLTLPRVVTSLGDGALASAPVPELSALRVDPSGVEVTGRADGFGAQLEFLLECGGGPGCVVRLHFGPSEYLEVAVDHRAGRVSVDRSRASRDPRAYGGAVTISGLDELRAPGATIRGFVDGSILELFLPGGRVATVRCYPTTPPPWQLELVTAAPGVRLCVWELTGSDR